MAGEFIVMRRPDDWHSHLRQDELLEKVVPFSNPYGRVTAMGNLTPPIVTVADVKRYRMKILTAGAKFQPIMTIMLVNRTTPEILEKAFAEGVRILKLIPSGTSTNSDDGIALTELERFYPVLETARRLSVVFSIHCELVKNHGSEWELPEWQRETAAISYLRKIIKDIPGLKIVVEHASTEEMISFVKKSPDNVAATLTAHHALLTYDMVCGKGGKIKNPFLYCKPVAKFEKDRKAVIETMVSGNPKFFFGSDCAPHPKEKKLGSRPAAGIFTPGQIALPLLIEIFRKAKKIEKLENFTSRFGAEFYGLPLNQGGITIMREEWTAPKEYNGIVPFMAGKKLRWKIF